MPGGLISCRGPVAEPIPHVDKCNRITSDTCHESDPGTIGGAAVAGCKLEMAYGGSARDSLPLVHKLQELGDIVITTYTMIAFTGTRSAESRRAMDAIENREWGLLLMDEVHVVPAEMFRKVSKRGGRTLA